MPEPLDPEIPINFPFSILKFKFHFQAKIEIGQYILDKNKRTLSIGRKNIKLTEKEQDIIVYLFGKKDGANKKDIMKDIWSYSDEVDTHTYETHLYRLRQKIQLKLKDKNFIEFKRECSKTGTTEDSLASAEKIGFKTNLTATNPLDKTKKVPVYFGEYKINDISIASPLIFN